MPRHTKEEVIKAARDIKPSGLRGLDEGSYEISGDAGAANHSQERSSVMNNERKVFVLVYTHKHGDDLSVYDTEEHAVMSACDIIEEYINDVEDETVKAAIKLAILECAWNKAFDIWCKYQRDLEWASEDITIYTKEVLGGE